MYLSLKYNREARHGGIYPWPKAFRRQRQESIAFQTGQCYVELRAWTLVQIENLLNMPKPPGSFLSLEKEKKKKQDYIKQNFSIRFLLYADVFFKKNLTDYCFSGHFYF